MIRRRRQQGQSSMDYALFCAAIAVALFVPLRDAASPEEPRTAVEIVLAGFKTAYRNISYAISLP